MIYDVVCRLNLNVEYTTEGRFYNPVLYGDQLPVNISFNGLTKRESVSLVIKPKSDKEVILTGFIRNGNECPVQSIVARIGAKTNTPVGIVIVSYPKYKHYAKFTNPIYV
ncbi:MAG: chromosome partitioning protein ParA, partial [Prevotellaceae bacterium]|nr:chromosome partitioning protein ParA [Prevotellaceae bacterium]